MILLHVLPFPIARLCCFSEREESLPHSAPKKVSWQNTYFQFFYRHFEKSQSMKFVILILMQNYTACRGCACKSWSRWGSEIKYMTDTNPIRGVQTQADSPVLFFLSNRDHKPRNFFQKMN